MILNDIHSRLNPTRVREVVTPQSLEAVQAQVERAVREGLAISTCGGRHAMGGQQFGEGCLQLDLSALQRVLALDSDARCVDVEAGIQWPQLIADLDRLQPGAAQPLTIRQKQTGADRLSVGGSASVNMHGRGLRYAPFVEDIESVVLIGAGGEARRCSRSENTELFRLAIGGYGLFGVIAQVRLRLVPRRHLRRVVEVTSLADIAATFEERLRSDFEYGDFQFMTDSASLGFMRQGVLSCYRPVPDYTPLTAAPQELSEADWNELLYLAHADRARAFAAYAQHYLGTDGQVYRSDLHQLGVYVDDYHPRLDQRLGATSPGSEMITEAYVPRDRLADFMEACREDFRQHAVEFIYGTIRLIEKDTESFLAWAREPWACVVFNLHVTHDAPGMARAQEDFRRIITRALERGGSYFLTYHRWATREQVSAAHPRFVDFLRAKLRHDPEERFQSEWYRHHRELFAAEL